MKFLSLLASCLLVPSMFLVGCGDSGSDSAATTGDPADDTLAPPAIGVQLTTQPVTVPAGAEQYSCWSFDLPADAPLQVTGIASQIRGAGVHHYAVFTNSAGGSNEEAYDCEAMGATWGLVTGGGIGTPAVRFPEGVAMELKASAHVIVQLHLLNAGQSDVTIEPQRFNLEGAEPGKEMLPVGLLIAGTLDIEVPAHGTNVEVSGGCTLDEPLQNVFAVFPHMHRLGQRITTTFTPAGGGDETSVSDITWDFSDQGLYEVKGSAAVGDTVTVKCQYDNPTEKDVHFGLHSGDEMCIDVLYHYPSTSGSKYCGIGG